MGNLFSLRNTRIDSMNSRNAREKHLHEQNATLETKAGDIHMSMNKNHSADFCDQKCNKKRKNSEVTISEPASMILVDVHQCCLILSSIESKMKDTAISTTQRNELMEYLGQAQCCIERITSIVRTNQNPLTIDSVPSCCHGDTGTTEASAKISKSRTTDDAFDFRQNSNSSLPVAKIERTYMVVKKGVGERYETNEIKTESVTSRTTKDHNSLVVTNGSGAHQPEKSKYGITDPICQSLSELDLTESKTPLHEKGQCVLTRNEQCQQDDCIPFGENDSDVERRSIESKLKQIENRRNEIKSEMDDFFGANTDPKFHELSEYSVRLLLELDDLIVPKDSGLHNRKRDLLKEVYQYDNILMKKAEDFEILRKVKQFINHILRNWDDIEKSISDLNEISGGIQYAKSDLGKIHYETISDGQVREFIEQLNFLENLVNNTKHQKNSNLSVYSKPEEIVEDAAHIFKRENISRGIRTKVNSSTSDNGNEPVIVNPHEDNEESNCTEKKLNGTRNDIGTTPSIGQPQELWKSGEQEGIEDDSVETVNPTSQLQVIEGRSGDHHSCRDIVEYETNTRMVTKLEDIRNKVHEVTGKIHSFDGYEAWEKCQVDLMQQHQRLSELNIVVGVSEEMLVEVKRKLMKEILHWLNLVGEQIQALQSISNIEGELEGLAQKFDDIAEKELRKCRRKLLRIRNYLQRIHSTGKKYSERVGKCDAFIQLYLNKIDEKTKTLYKGTQV